MHRILREPQVHSPVTWPPTSLQDGRAFLLLSADRDSETVEGAESAQGPGSPRPFGLQDGSEHVCQGRPGSMSGTPYQPGPHSGNGVACLGETGSPILRCTGSLYAHLEGCRRCKYWEAVAPPACYNSGTALPWSQLLDPGMPPLPGAGEALGTGAGPVAAFLGRKEGGRDRGREGQGPAAGHCCS